MRAVMLVGFLVVAVLAEANLCSGLCAGRICSTYSENKARGCDTQGCGNYGASRNGRTHKGVDVKCAAGATVYAPFPGKLERIARPYGNGKCCDTGVLYKGTGAWSNYKVKMFYVTAESSDMGKSFSTGQSIGSFVGLHCGDCYSSSMTNHIHFQLYQGSNIINPTSKVFC